MKGLARSGSGLRARAQAWWTRARQQAQGVAHKRAGAGTGGSAGQKNRRTRQTGSGGSDCSGVRSLVKRGARLRWRAGHGTAQGKGRGGGGGGGGVWRECENEPPPPPPPSPFFFYIESLCEIQAPISNLQNDN